MPAIPLHIRQYLGFCEGPPAARTKDQLPLLQPWTWFQLSMTFCFTASGNGT